MVMLWVKMIYARSVTAHTVRRADAAFDFGGRIRDVSGAQEGGRAWRVRVCPLRNVGPHLGRHCFLASRPWLSPSPSRR